MNVIVDRKDVQPKGYGCYAGIYEMNFLDDKNWKVEVIEMKCLKLKVETGTILENTTGHFPDTEMFKVYDVITGPMEVIPLMGKNYISQTLNQ